MRCRSGKRGDLRRRGRLHLPAEPRGSAPSVGLPPGLELTESQRFLGLVALLWSFWKVRILPSLAAEARSIRREVPPHGLRRAGACGGAGAGLSPNLTSTPHGHTHRGPSNIPRGSEPGRFFSHRQRQLLDPGPELREDVRQRELPTEEEEESGGERGRGLASPRPREPAAGEEPRRRSGRPRARRPPTRRPRCPRPRPRPPPASPVSPRPWEPWPVALVASLGAWGATFLSGGRRRSPRAARSLPVARPAFPLATRQRPPASASVTSCTVGKGPKFEGSRGVSRVAAPEAGG